MGLGVTRYIEVNKEICERMIYFEDLSYIGHWKDNDIVFIYNENKCYKIMFGDMGYIHYTPIDNHDIDNADIVFHASSKSILPTKQLPLYDGVVYAAMVDGNKRYFVYKERNGRFIRKETCPRKWVLLKYLTHDDITELSYSTGGNMFIQDYIYRGKFAKRGLPNDITPEIKSDITEYDFGATSVLLSEIESVYDKSIEDFNALMKKYIDNAGVEKIDKKMLLLLKHFNIKYTDNKFEEDLLEYFDDDFTSELSFFEVISNEINTIMTLVNVNNLYETPENIRITYTFNN